MIRAHEAAIAALFVAVAAAGLFFTSWHAINLRPWRTAFTFTGTLVALGALTAAAEDAL